MKKLYKLDVFPYVSTNSVIVYPRLIHFSCDATGYINCAFCKAFWSAPLHLGPEQPDKLLCRQRLYKVHIKVNIRVLRFSIFLEFQKWVVKVLCLWV